MKFIKYFLISVVCLVMGIVYSREVPKLKKWILGKITTLSREKGVEISAQEINFKLLPPGIELIGMKLEPKGPMARTLAPSTIDSVQVYLSPASLIAGRFEIGNITVNHPATSVFLRKAQAKPAGKGQNSDPWDQVVNIPVQSLDVNDAQIRVRIEAGDLALQLRNFSLNLVKNYKAGKFDLFAPDVMIKRGDGKVIQLGASTRVVAERNALEISALKLTQGNSYVIARGLGRGDVTKLEFPLVNGRAIVHADVAEATELARILVPQTTIPVSKGEVTLEVTAQQERGRDLSLAAQLETQNIQIAKFQIGDVSTKLSYSNNVARAKSVKFSSPAGKFNFQDVEVHTGKETRVAARVNLDGVELQQLLFQLAVGHGRIPLHMDLTGSVPCEGLVVPEIRFECAGDVNGANFRIWNEDSGKTIAALKSFKITAGMLADKEKLTFPKAMLTIGSSTGTAKGEISFAKGFTFNYHSDKLDFSDITSLADLHYNGAIDITGVTSGDGHAAIMDATILSKDFWFENYGLGDVNMGLRYEKGYLKLSDVTGRHGSLKYDGNANIKLADDERGHTGVEAAHFNFGNIDLTDLEDAFSRKVKLPFDAAGTGSGTVDVSGPFSLSKLNYKLHTQVQHPTVAGESFQELRFDVHGVNGHAFADDVHAKKGDGLVKLTGDVLNSGMMNVVVTGRNLQLADMEHVRSITTAFDGKLNADMTMKEFILAPHVAMSGFVTSTTLNQQILDDSTFDLAINPMGFKFNGQIFNQKINLGFAYPFKEDQPFALKFETKDWDFSSLLGLLGKNQLKRDYEASLTAKVDLQSPEGGFWKSTGNILVNKFTVRRGQSQMRNVDNIFVRFDDGLITVKQLQIEGDNTRLSVTGSKNRKDMLNFNINGRVDMSLLMFLTPFLRDMSGDMQMSTQIGGTLTHPDLLGSAYIKKGYFKTDVLPQPFEDVNIDATFSQARVLVNRLTGHVGGGNLSGAGTITFNSFGDVPVELSGELLGTTLTVPDGVTTHGDFHFGITGNWFPYLLKGDYNVENGTYAVNLGDEQAEGQVKRSTYLPKLIMQKDFIPLSVDLSTHFQKGMSVKNNMFEGDVKGDLEIKGDPSHAVLKGDVNAVPGSKILFRDTPFNVIDARLKFTNPSENNPTIYAQAGTRVRDWDVGLLIQGTKNKYKIDLNSTPPLPEHSIVQLLALGTIDEDDTRPVAQTTFAGSNAPAPVQSQETLQSYEGYGVLLEKIPVRTEIKKRLGVNVRLTQTQDAGNVIMPKIVAEKVWSPSWSMAFSRTIGDRVANDYNVEYKFSRHLSLLGTYEIRDYDPLALSGTALTTQQTTIQSNILGVDLQFQVDFK
jgi:translocation and assembly module TamB